MPTQLLDVVSQEIVLWRNGPRRIDFEGMQENGVSANFSDCLAARLRIGHALAVDAASVITTYTDLFPNGPYQSKLFTAAEIAALPLGQFLYEMQVSWVEDIWITAFQGSITIVPSAFELNET
jgi:hypothetical protein